MSLSQSGRSSGDLALQVEVQVEVDMESLRASVSATV